MGRDQAIDLSRLPQPIPRVQMGEPLSDEDLAKLPESQRQALTALFEQAESLLFEGAPLTLTSYAELVQRYDRVKRLGLIRYCSVVQIGAKFRLDEEAETKAAEAVMGVLDQVGECWGCH